MKTHQRHLIIDSSAVSNSDKITLSTELIQSKASHKSLNLQNIIQETYFKRF